MNELKTLDEITSWTCECNCVTFDNGICRSCGKLPKYGSVCHKELKQEAIKWVKEYSNEKTSTPLTYKQVMKQVFSEFFNITEGDLK